MSSIRFEIPSFQNGDPIPDEFTFCNPADEGHVTFGSNKNPYLRLSEVPDSTASLAIICVDIDAPSDSSDANIEGKMIPKDLPRADFYHWVLVDIPSSVSEIPVGAACDGVTPRGKDPGKGEFGVNGINSYTDWFAGDEDMEGVYGGYDGPCPPWNDELVHRYYFRIYALDIPSLNLSGEFTGVDAIEAMEGHMLDHAEWMGTYTLNKKLR